MELPKGENYFGVSIKKRALRKVAPQRDAFAKVHQSELYPQLPFSMVVVGPSNSGKSTFINKLIQNKDRELAVDYDYHTCFGMPAPNFDYPRQMRYRPNPCPTKLTLGDTDPIPVPPN